jgi:two-component system cell cycle sensor histidine kinase/response regulator CckA
MILVADDEPQLVALMTRYLERLGYVVVADDTAEGAWERIEAEPARFALAVFDATLPGIGGEELARKVLEKYPAMRVIVASGYAVDLATLQQAHGERVTFLQKPFAPEMLADAVRRLLPSA